MSLTASAGSRRCCPVLAATQRYTVLKPATSAVEDNLPTISAEMHRFYAEKVATATASEPHMQ